MFIVTIKWIGKGIFILYTITTFIGIFYQLNTPGYPNYFSLFELLFIVISMGSIFVNLYDLYSNAEMFQNIDTRNVRLFLLSNFIWGFLAINYPLWKLFKQMQQYSYFTLRCSIEVLRMIHIFMFTIWLVYAYNKIPQAPKSRMSRTHYISSLLNIITLIYYISYEITVNTAFTTRLNTSQMNVEYLCQNYTGSQLQFCQGQSFFEAFFYASCCLSILLLFNRLKNSFSRFPRTLPRFYHKRISGNIRKARQSLLAFVLAGLIIFMTVYSLTNFYLNSKNTQEQPLILYNFFNLTIYLLGIISAILLIWEMRKWEFTNEPLSKIDKQILELGTTGQLIYGMSIVITSVNISYNYQLSEPDRQMNLSSFFSYAGMIVQLVTQRTVAIQLYKLKHETYRRSTSKFILQFCPSMVLMVLNFCMIPTSFFFMVYPTSLRLLVLEMDSNIWTLFLYAKAPVMILHRLHGSIVFGYNLYQTW